MQFEFANATEHMHQDVKRKVMACMETGQIDMARTVLEEYKEDWPERAKDLTLDVIASYGTGL